ncbi:MAG TPA: valine--tRNA ligase [Stellaceae bacterium]|nr:valine--tRNA ligase [Stellaceae bacterium]
MLDKTYRPAEVEAEQYAAWEASGAFAADPASTDTPYTVMMPPPNVTGVLHMGHALTFTLQDILVRYHRMKGFDTLWQPGTDHAGIATQMVVERQLEQEQSNRHKLGRQAFIERVWQWKAQSGGAITQQLRRLGASPDWRRERFTMDPGLSAAVVKVFVALHREGLIYRDKRLVNWDPKLHTAISDLEVENIEMKGHLWHFRYPLEGDDGQFITVATTRPETMFGDSGVAVHPEDPRYRDLIGRHVILPLVGRRIPIVADDYADPETGSGAVKITPAHDFNDFKVGERHGLERINVFDADAHLNDAVPEAYRGLERFEARRRVVAEMEALGLLEKVDEHRLTVPHGDRSGVPIEPWLTDQWYCDAATLAKPALEAVEQGRTRFVPEQWTATYYDWMRNIQPWCISRQIWWGHQIPAWFGSDGTIFVEETEREAAAAAEKHYGRAVELQRDQDVLDTWFSSALWPFSTLGWPERTPELAKYYPTNVLVTGFDIIFFWVARMMMMGLHFTGTVPFDTVYIHALVRDERGQKMSKSKGNVIDPLELIDTYGCDALRFTLAALAAQGRDIKLAASRVEGYRNFATKLWNAARYAEMNGAVAVGGFQPGACGLTVNRWIVGETARAAERAGAAIEAYKFNEAAMVLYQFVWGSFCDWYIELTKPMLLGDDAAAVAETRATMAWVLGQILHLLHPIMPFVTEELWGQLSPAGSEKLITAAWPVLTGLEDSVAAAEIDWLLRLVSEIRAMRAEMNVPPGALLPLSIREAGPLTQQRLAAHRDSLCRLARLAGAELLPAGAPDPAGSAQIVLDEATILVPLGDFIDFAKERARLTKELAEIDGEIGKIDRKLGNEQFVAKAKPEVVEEQHERRADFAQRKAKLLAAVARLV